jgi:hypothetical protein
MESRLNRDFNKIFRILKMNKKSWSSCESCENRGSDKSHGGAFYLPAENKSHQWDIDRVFIERIFALKLNLNRLRKGA